MATKKCRLTDEQFNRIMEASKPVPYMVFGGMGPRSPQENANAAWREVAKEHGVHWQTIRPCGGDGRDFTAESAPEESAVQP